MTVDLLALFESLVLPLEPPSGTNLSAIPIPGCQTHRLAKDANGSPCVLLRQPHGAARPASIHLQNLSTSYDVPCISSNRRREHYFSQAQLSGPGPSRVIIASLFVARTGADVLLRRLFEQNATTLGE